MVGQRSGMFNFRSAFHMEGGFSGGFSGKEPTCQCKRHQRHGFHPWVGKIPWGSARQPTWRSAWQPAPVFLPGESHGQRSLAGYSPQSCKESDTTETTQHTCTQGPSYRTSETVYDVPLEKARQGRREFLVARLNVCVLRRGKSYLQPTLPSPFLERPQNMSLMCVVKGGTAASSSL